ncbi:MAG: sulfite exporter TauE/SafE family protein [Planctomycetes bacterium]|nr:sulfite exporter TauE/SafE family protein [Planctomycetota bacterium]
MIALLASVLVASLVGSSHCAGMCGGIAAFCGGAGECGGRRSLAASGVYHLSRLASYAIVGALAGAFGVLLNSGGALVGAQQIAAIAAGVAVALVGVGMLLQAGGIDSGRMPLPQWMKKLLGAVHQAAAAMRPIRRALVVGLATPLLPCGWLWAFAAVAAGTASIMGGLLVMIAFWVGTVPILTVVGVGIASLGGTQRRVMAAIAGAIMIAVGIYTAGIRAPMAPRVAQQLAQREHDANAADSIHAGAVRDTSDGANLSAVTDGPPACCSGEPPK